MSDDPNETENNQDGEELPRRQRAAEERAQKAEERAAQLEREAAMRDAGVDLKTPLGQLILTGYTGELTDDAIKEYAASLGIGTPGENTEGQEGEGETDPDDGSTEARRKAAGGAHVADGEGATEDPRLAAIKEGDRVLTNAGSREAAIGAAFDVIAEAGYGKGDERAIWRPGKTDPRRPVDNTW